MNSAVTSTSYKDFEETVVSLMSTLNNYALHLTMNSEDAKDLLQETYLKAFRFWHMYESGTNIKAWLYQIMKNSYINIYRKKVKEPRKVEYNEGQFYKAIDGSDNFDPKFYRGKKYDDIFEDEITSTLNSLPEDFKNIVLLSDYEDLTYKEIAEILNCPIGTVRSRLHRGRKQMQKKLYDFVRDNGYISKEFLQSNI